MTHTVTKAIAIQFINGKCHNYNETKSHKTDLSGYYACVSHDLILMALGADTQTHIHIPMHLQKRSWPRVLGLKTHFV